MAAALVATLLLQALLCASFVRVVRRRTCAAQCGSAHVGPVPVAEVVLCLRGVDPALDEALSALAAQRYPRAWRLLVIVDSMKDPAWNAVGAAIRRLEEQACCTWQNARMSVLAGPPATGSRKSAALRQAFAHLDPATELVALVDADAVVGPEWLRALAEACVQSGVGAAGGNRWYLPAHRSGPGMVRSIWNCGALVLMTLLTIPWGGSLAIRRQLIEATGWREALRTSLCEDTALTRPLRRAGWRFQFSPTLIAVDRNDSIRLRPLIRWIARQLLMARLHHPAWPLVLLHGLGTALLLLGALLVVTLLIVQGRAEATLPLLAGLLAYEFGCGVLLIWIQAVVADAIHLPERLQLQQWLRWLPLAQVAYGMAVVRAQLARRVEWSGITYSLRGRSVVAVPER
ncbi:MAG: glycosyltransferase [Cyanobacteriota bacterium]